MRKDQPINFCREMSVGKRFNPDKLFEFKQLSVRKRFSPDKLGIVNICPVEGRFLRTFSDFTRRFLPF